ncbi:general stress protein [Devriesea agamarum]|uniref:general stress protein n=1 Tax=Devriesea agamarum TaxID=472569 RepID=UPI000AC43916|nr:general stress protein [Devriesea agamarum]
MTTPASSPLTARLYRLEYPRSLGVYSTYEEVQAVVDTLADHNFPVQNTMIVGTDLKLIERVTGRRTWGRVLLSGALSGAWLGLFVGAMFMLISRTPFYAVISVILMGLVFGAIWAAIGNASLGGKRDFTSMTATIPMQYELMVEHRYLDQARNLLHNVGSTGPAQHYAPTHPSHYPPAAQPQHTRTPHYPSATGHPPQAAHTAPTQNPNRPTYGIPAPAHDQQQTGTEPPARPRPQYGMPAPTDGSTHPNRLNESHKPAGANGVDNVNGANENTGPDTPNQQPGGPSTPRSN